MWRLDSPRPSVAAYATAARMLMDTSEPVEVKPHKDVYAYVFRKGNGSIAAIWTTLADPVALQFQMPKDAKIYDMMSNDVPRTRENATSLIVTDAPIFIVSKQRR